MGTLTFNFSDSTSRFINNIICKQLTAANSSASVTDRATLFCNELFTTTNDHSKYTTNPVITNEYRFNLDYLNYFNEPREGSFTIYNKAAQPLKTTDNRQWLLQQSRLSSCSLHLNNNFLFHSYC